MAAFEGRNGMSYAAKFNNGTRIISFDGEPKFHSLEEATQAAVKRTPHATCACDYIIQDDHTNKVVRIVRHITGQTPRVIEVAE